MGYSHYFTNVAAPTKSQFAAIVKDANALRAHLGDKPLAFVTITADCLADDALCLKPDVEPREFMFIKTYGDVPYDTFVVALSCVLRRVLGESWAYSSDNVHEWEEEPEKGDTGATGESSDEEEGPGQTYAEWMEYVDAAQAEKETEEEGMYYDGLQAYTKVTGHVMTLFDLLRAPVQFVGAGAASA